MLHLVCLEMGVRAARGFTSLFKIPVMDEDKVLS
jgi:hypothetical protein